MLHEEFLEEFHQKDSILEPKVLKTLEKFLQIGGTLEEAVDIMVASFVDLPASINKMIEFLTISGTYSLRCLSLFTLIVCVH